MRSIWKGAISFGLVTIPVRLYSATEERDVTFHQVHRTDAGRIRYKRVCSACGEEVAFADIAKGFELPTGETVVLTDDDFADLPLTTSRSIDVLEFVPLEQVDPIFFTKSYYLEPDKTGTKPYVLLREALEASGRVAVVKVALRQRESLATLRVRDGVFVLEVMLWPDEIRTPAFGFLDEECGGSAAGAADGPLAHRQPVRRLRPDAVLRQLPGGAAGAHRREGRRARGRRPRAQRRAGSRGGPHGGTAGECGGGQAHPRRGARGGAAVPAGEEGSEGARQEGPREGRGEEGPGEEGGQEVHAQVSLTPLNSAAWAADIQDVTDVLPDYAEIVAALRAVPGVAHANVRPDADGAGLLQLGLEPDADEAAVAGQVGRLLLERFGVGIDAEHIGMLEDASVEQEHEPEPGRGRRVAIRRMQLMSSGLDVTATVVLAQADREAVGEARGTATQSGVHRAVAGATLRAVEALVDGQVRFELEAVEVTALAGERTVVVAVTLVGPGGHDRLTGSATVRQDVRQACIRAALDAVNRRVEPLLG